MYPTPTWSWDAFYIVIGGALAKVLRGEPVPALHADLHLLDDLGMDSSGVLELLDELEQRLGVDIPAFSDEPTLRNLYLSLSNRLVDT